ncbi:hypothetical protein B0H10DRAFT_439614 [Mycena sp. CBHHK59/15]|nr:hypothetical protein B0H10DRAFT_439614 [Mycena sp. CBHHK59/15]
MRSVDEAAPNENARPRRARPGGRSRCVSAPHSLTDSDGSDALSTSNAHFASGPARPDFSREVSAPQTPRSPFVHRARTRLRPRLPPSASSFVCCPSRLCRAPPSSTARRAPTRTADLPRLRPRAWPRLACAAPLQRARPHAKHPCGPCPARVLLRTAARAPPTPRTRRPCSLRRDNACLDLSAQRASRRCACTDHLGPNAECRATPRVASSPYK